MNINMENKKIEDMNVIELKAMLFDIDMEVKKRQYEYQQIAQVLQDKFNKQKEEVIEEVKENGNNS